MSNNFKPKILYHGSPIGGMDELEPRNKHTRDPHEGPVIFAAVDIPTASIFMLGHASNSGLIDDVPYVVLVGSREDYIKNDRGGHIYFLSGDTFENDPKKGLGVHEWVSRKNVKPIRVLTYQSALDGAMENGVQVYFVDEATQREIASANDHGISILKNLESENQRRGVNVRTL